MLYPCRVRQLVFPVVAGLLTEPLSNASKRHTLTRHFPPGHKHWLRTRRIS